MMKVFGGVDGVGVGRGYMGRCGEGFERGSVGRGLMGLGRLGKGVDGGGGGREGWR